MSPKARDRAREKRRHEKRQMVLNKRQVEAQRNKQVIGVVLAMILVIGGLVGLSVAMKQDDTSATPLATGTPSSQASSTATGATTPTAAAKPIAGCVTPPKVPTDKRSGTLPDKKIAAGKTFIAAVTTNCGVITMELDGTKAPQTVASFVGLAKSGYWADSPCHRLTSDNIFVLQCGDPTGAGTGSPGYGFGVENAPADFTFAPGALAMARGSDPNSNGGQFFIVYKTTVLNDPTGYSIFGKITTGLDIVNKIAAAGTTAGDGPPVQPISILKVDVTEKKA